MAQLPADRTKLAQAQGNMTPTFTASSQKLKDALTEAYDTVDLLNQKVNDHGAAATLPHADKSVSRAKLADKVVGAGQLDDTAVGQIHHQDNGIPSRALPDNVILQRHMSDNSVGSAEIQAGAVTATKIPNGTINSQHMDAALLASSASLSTQAEFDKRGINVQKFGAKGDGVTDDTAAIDAAINYCLANKKKLNFVDGTYIYNRATTWYMDGGYTGKFIDWVGNRAKIIFPRLDIAYWAFYKMEYVNIEGIDFEGPGAVGAAPNENAFGVAVYSAKRVTIKRCSFSKFVGDGLFISAEQANDRNLASQNLLVENCYFDNNGRGGLTIVGLVSGLVQSNYFTPARLMVAPYVGEQLHIESDPSTRYGVEGLTIQSNIVYGVVNLSNPSWQTGWVGEKDSWIVFKNNKVIVADAQYGIISAGGNLKIIDNEIDVTRITPADDLGAGALFLKCNSLILERNTVKATGKGTMVTIYNWTHDNKGKIILKENSYITSSCSYVYRFYKDANTTLYPNLHRVVRIINDSYAGLTGNWLMSAPIAGGSSLRYYFESINWNASNGIEMLNTLSTHIIYMKNCTIAASTTLLRWDAIGSAYRFYYENCNITSGTVTAGVSCYPVDLFIVYRISAASSAKDPSWNTTIYGRTNTLTKTAVGVYQWDAFTRGELYSYTFSATPMLNTAETGVFNITYKIPATDGALPTFEVRNAAGTLIDLPDTNRIQIVGKLYSTGVVTALTQ